MMHRELIVMCCVFLLDMGFTIAGCVVGIAAYDELHQSNGVFKGRLSLIISCVLGISAITAVLAGLTFWTVGSFNVNHNKRLLNNSAQCTVQQKPSVIWLSPWGCVKLLGIVIGALGYLSIPYLMAVAQIQVWIVNQDQLVSQLTHTQSIRDAVYAVNGLVYVVGFLRLIELALGHGWAVARTACLEKGSPAVKSSTKPQDPASATLMANA